MYHLTLCVLSFSGSDSAKPWYQYEISAMEKHCLEKGYRFKAKANVGWLGRERTTLRQEYTVKEDDAA